MPHRSRPPLEHVPLFLRCTRCRQPQRAMASFVRPVIVSCVACRHPMRLVPS